MSENFNKLKNIYDDIYKLTLIIDNFIEEENFDNIEEALSKRATFFVEAQKIVRNSGFSQVQETERKAIVEKIKKLDEVVIQKFEEKKQHAKQMINKLNTNNKVISAYKTSTEVSSIIIDTME